MWLLMVSNSRVVISNISQLIQVSGNRLLVILVLIMLKYSVWLFLFIGLLQWCEVLIMVFSVLVYLLIIVSSIISIIYSGLIFGNRVNGRYRLLLVIMLVSLLRQVFRLDFWLNLWVSMLFIVFSVMCRNIYSGMRVNSQRWLVKLVISVLISRDSR